MTIDPALLAARARADAARTRLGETLSVVQDRISPSTIAHDAWSKAVDRGADAWETAIDHGSRLLDSAIDEGSEVVDEAVVFARRQPGAAAAAIAGLVALFAAPPLIRRMSRSRRAPPVTNDPPRLTGPIPHPETRL